MTTKRSTDRRSPRAEEMGKHVNPEAADGDIAWVLELRSLEKDLENALNANEEIISVRSELPAASTKIVHHVEAGAPFPIESEVFCIGLSRDALEHWRKTKCLDYKLDYIARYIRSEYGDFLIRHANYPEFKEHLYVLFILPDVPRDELLVGINGFLGNRPKDAMELLAWGNRERLLDEEPILASTEIVTLIDPAWRNEFAVGPTDGAQEAERPMQYRFDFSADGHGVAYADPHKLISINAWVGTISLVVIIASGAALFFNSHAATAYFGRFTEGLLYIVLCLCFVVFLMIADLSGIALKAIQTQETSS